MILFSHIQQKKFTNRKNRFLLSNKAVTAEKERIQSSFKHNRKNIQQLLHAVKETKQGPQKTCNLYRIFGGLKNNLSRRIENSRRDLSRYFAIR